MSWSIAIIGSPENVATALTAQSEKLEGQSKVEFDSAMPHLIGLVKENFGPDNPVVKLAANGHGYAADGEQKQRYFTATIERVYVTIV